MSESLSVFNNVEGLLPVAELIQGELNKSLNKILEKLPVSDIDIIISDDSKRIIPELGIGGYAPNDHQVFIYLNPQFPHLRETIQKHLKRTLAHELHHCMRWRSPGYGHTLLEVLVSEGLADHFDLEVNGGEAEPWCRALKAGEVAKFTEIARTEYFNRDYSHKAWFFGSKERGIPRWTGYTLGFKLVGDYLKSHPDQKPSTLYTTKAQELIDTIAP